MSERSEDKPSVVIVWTLVDDPQAPEGVRQIPHKMVPKESYDAAQKRIENLEAEMKLLEMESIDRADKLVEAASKIHDLKEQNRELVEALKDLASWDYPSNLKGHDSGQIKWAIDKANDVLKKYGLCEKCLEKDGQDYQQATNEIEILRRENHELKERLKEVEKFLREYVENH